MTHREFMELKVGNVLRLAYFTKARGPVVFETYWVIHEIPAERLDFNMYIELVYKSADEPKYYDVGAKISVDYHSLVNEDALWSVLNPSWRNEFSCAVTH